MKSLLIVVPSLFGGRLVQSGGGIKLRHNVHHFLLHIARRRDALVARLVGTRELPCYIW